MEPLRMKSSIQKSLETDFTRRVGIISESAERIENQGPLTCRTSLRKRFGNKISLFKDKELTDFG